jgi:hypothetical protein
VFGIRAPAAGDRPSASIGVHDTGLGEELAVSVCDGESVKSPRFWLQGGNAAASEPVESRIWYCVCAPFGFTLPVIVADCGVTAVACGTDTTGAPHDTKPHRSARADSDAARSTRITVAVTSAAATDRRANRRPALANRVTTQT